MHLQFRSNNLCFPNRFSLTFAVKVRRLTNLGNIVTLVVSGIAVILWVAATVYFKLWDTGKPFKYDLWCVFSFPFSFPFPPPSLRYRTIFGGLLFKKLVLFDHC